MSWWKIYPGVKLCWLPDRLDSTKLLGSVIFSPGTHLEHFFKDDFFANLKFWWILKSSMHFFITKFDFKAVQLAASVLRNDIPSIFDETPFRLAKLMTIKSSSTGQQSPGLLTLGKAMSHVPIKNLPWGWDPWMNIDCQSRSCTNSPKVWTWKKFEESRQ